MSEIRANTISDAAGTGPVTLTKQSAAKVHLFFDHASNAVGGSLNVSSVTDAGIGDFGVNFTTSFVTDTQRALAACAVESGVRGLFITGPDDNSPSFAAMRTRDHLAVPYDSNRAGVSIHGDLA